MPPCISAWPYHVEMVYTIYITEHGPIARGLPRTFIFMNPLFKKAYVSVRDIQVYLFQRSYRCHTLRVRSRYVVSGEHVKPVPWVPVTASRVPVGEPIFKIYLWPDEFPCDIVNIRKQISVRR